MPEFLPTFDTPFTVPFRHRVLFTDGCLNPDNPALASLLMEPGAELTGAHRRAIAFIDGGVAAAWPNLHAQLHAYAAQPGMPRLCHVENVPAGEACKQNSAVADRVVQLVDEHGIDRQSFVLSIGGGAVQDAVGYGASIAHRGCRLVRVATTTLAQGDAAMAVKNGINTGGKKNFTGTFSVPWGVVCDQAFLPTSPEWSWCGGFSEAVKIALLRDEELFLRIERDASRIRERDMNAAMPVITRSAELHYRHIVSGGDPFENSSARPLDFGHWVAHKLESLSGGALPHGQAVAVGVVLDSTYSACMGLLPMEDARRVACVLRALGLPVWHDLLSTVEASARLHEGLNEFREHLGGRLTITLLRGIGQAVDVHEVHAEQLERALVEAAGMGHA